MPIGSRLSDRVRAHAADLSAAELRVAEVFVDEEAALGFLTAAALAARAGASDATVIRAAQHLGFAGLAELKRFVADGIGAAGLSHRLRTSIANASVSGSALLQAVQVQSQALERLEVLATSPAFDDAVALLADAKRIVVNGTGPSASLATYAVVLLQRIGIDATSMTQTGTAAADEIIRLRRGDTLLVLAYTRLHGHVELVLDRATELQLPVIACTDILRLARDAEPRVVLDVGRGAPGAFASHGATIVLLEALIVALAARAPEQAAESLDQLNGFRAVLAGRRLDVDRWR
jgi:DNA-binding MurR/RpiR family transcriptional regulator